jgi:hypothetical protein
MAGGIVAEGRQAVQGDPAPNGVESSLRKAERAGAVGQVSRDAGESGGDLLKAGDLLARE